MSNTKEKIAHQLMGSKTGLLSATIAERLDMTKETVNSALEEMRKVQDVKKGSKIGLENHRWTMTDMGRLNYRVEETPLIQVAPILEIDDELKTLSQSVFDGEDDAYRYASVVQGRCELATNVASEKKDSFGNTYLGYPLDTFCKVLKGSFKPFDGFIERKSQNEIEVKNNVPSDVALNPELFELVKVIDEKNAAIFELFNRKPKQIILNRENKINALHKLCGSGILSNGTVAILNDIIGDLQVE